MSRKRILIIHNPTSGRRSANLMGAVVTGLTALGARVDIRVTEYAGHATALAAEVTGDSQDCIVAAGGDGTVNEVINGLARLDVAPPLGILPLGTANVLAHELTLPKSATALAEILFDGNTQTLYPGRIKGEEQPERLFAQMAGVGMDARIVAGVSGPMKRLLGKGAYACEAARQWLKGGLPTYQIDIDGTPHQARSMIIANGKLYGGRFVAAPDADISIRGFDILLLEGGRFDMLANTLALLVNRLSSKSGVRVVKGRKITIFGPAGEPVQADGDDMGTLPVTIEAVPDPLMVIGGQ
ncbi:MAG: diacylglycerol kinase family lipid kinase [Rhodospirillaceae bacterium]|jgi:diacylglycerol kinase (ATP)|nr:diacylglycerol kinase family lipid kinase [Rhodospirillaceae bacterium]MBT5244842.1 diacylglycerol kinase family lipid kinase [Rhodospirillaceae bacterium]MBT5563622.1 diacylglycerol kinase family lipid kinase [Rhodospirillaceae bacterium]MBT6241453.1 diacylglycerol kinase family lipid kinase [Rhodospirillaceae bacterium]MBT7138844.1 diacylglycerol kinase family lipid kinase [Rhodospirillaceae bacterium]